MAASSEKGMPAGSTVDASGQTPRHTSATLGQTRPTATRETQDDLVAPLNCSNMVCSFDRSRDQKGERAVHESAGLDMHHE